MKTSKTHPYFKSRLFIRGNEEGDCGMEIFYCETAALHFGFLAVKRPGEALVRKNGQLVRLKEFKGGVRKILAKNTRYHVAESTSAGGSADKQNFKKSVVQFNLVFVVFYYSAAGEGIGKKTKKTN